MVFATGWNLDLSLQLVRQGLCPRTLLSWMICSALQRKASNRARSRPRGMSVSSRRQLPFVHQRSCWIASSGFVGDESDRGRVGNGAEGNALALRNHEGAPQTAHGHIPFAGPPSAGKYVQSEMKL